MMFIYVKTHNVTGLKYLGFTRLKDPHAYKGSGSHWLKHLRKHGDDISTEIILQSDDLDELKETGEFFSKLWNVVESKEWANEIPETCSGYTPEISKEIQRKYLEKGTHPLLNVWCISENGVGYSVTKEEYRKGGHIHYTSKRGFEIRGIDESTRKLPPRMTKDILKNTKVTLKGDQRTDKQKEASRKHSQRLLAGVG